MDRWFQKFPLSDAPRVYFIILALFYLFSAITLLFFPHVFSLSTTSIFVQTPTRFVVGGAELLAGASSVVASVRGGYRFRICVGVILAGTAAMVASVSMFASLMRGGDLGRTIAWFIIFALHLHYLSYHLPTHEIKTALDRMSKMLAEVPPNEPK